MIRWVAPVIQHPGMTVFIGLALAFSGIMDVLEETVTGFESKIGTHHGMVFLGMVTMLRGFAEGLRGVDLVVEGEEKD